MATTGSSRQGNIGYSLIELLVVLAIVGILVIAGVTMLGNRGGNSVRVVLDELEGAVADARQCASSSGQDVAIVTWGTWNAMSSTPTLVMARGAASQTSTTIQTVANNLLASPPVMPTTTVGQSVSVVFAPTRSREYMNAVVVVNGTNGWTNALQPNGSGRSNPDIATVVPFNGDANFMAAYTAANNLFQSGLNQVTISGSNSRFNNSFFIQVVASSSGGLGIPGGAMGLLVVLNNGASIYKFYNSGVNNGDGQWRRI
jgi:prepilin-type N-terminal cleavage/methylation domain-containing protein